MKGRRDRLRQIKSLAARAHYRQTKYSELHTVGGNGRPHLSLGALVDALRLFRCALRVNEQGKAPRSLKLGLCPQPL